VHHRKEFFIADWELITDHERETFEEHHHPQNVEVPHNIEGSRQYQHSFLFITIPDNQML